MDEVENIAKETPETNQVPGVMIDLFTEVDSFKPNVEALQEELAEIRGGYPRVSSFPIKSSKQSDLNCGTVTVDFELYCVRTTNSPH